MLNAVDHIDLRVPDLEQAVSFLDKLGLQVLRRTEPPRRSVEMALPGEHQVVFELRESDVAGTTVDHIAFRASSSAVPHLIGQGLTFDSEHVIVGATGRTVSNLRDPFGGRWQLAE